MVGGASIYPFAWSILLAARDEGLAGVMTTMVVREEAAVKELLGYPTRWRWPACWPWAVPFISPPGSDGSPVESFATVDRFDGPPAPRDGPRDRRPRYR